MPAPAESGLKRTFGETIRPVRGPGLPFAMWVVEATDAARLSHLLSDAERQRMLRFRTAALRNRYATGHAVLRLLVQAHAGMPASTQDHAIDANGKPRLRGYEDLRYNISHSGDRTLIGIAVGADIGVDIERVRVIEDADAIARAHFTRRERRMLRRAPTLRTQSRRFLSVWTRKEACVKAVGGGLSLPLDKFHCGADSRIVHARIGADQLRSGIIDQKDGYLVGWAIRLNETR